MFLSLFVDFLIDNPEKKGYLVLKDDNKSEILQKTVEKLSKYEKPVSMLSIKKTKI